MSTNISEGLPAKKKAAPVVSAPKGGDKPDAKKGGTAENSAKRIRQAVYDIRYRARREDIDLKQAFSQYMSNTSMDQKDRAEVRSKLFGKGGVSEQYIGASDDWAIESFSKAFTTVFEHHQKDKDGNTIPHEDEFVTEYERKLSEEKARKYKVRVTDPKSEKSYVRYADREKITALRGKGLKVEMTEYGTPYEGEKKRGEETAKALGGGKKAKKDYDGDGKVESGSKEHAGAVHNAIQRAKGGKADGKDTRKEEYLADGTTSTEPTGKKINPKNVDNYKSGAVQVAPVDEADPQNGYGVKEGVEVKKKDNRANYAYINFMKNKMRAAFGVKNVMPMVNPDEAEEKFEKLATSMKGTSGDDDDDKMDESVQQAVQVLDELSKKTLNQYTYDAAQSRGREKGIKMAAKKLGKAKSARTVRKQKEDEDKGREVGHSRQEGPDRDANRSFGKPRQPYKKYMKKDKAAAEERAKKSGGFGNKATYGEKVDLSVQKTYDPLSNKGILEVSQNILKKNFNLGEEGYDIARDEGKVKPSKDKKDATTMPPSEEMKKTQKKNKGPSAYEIVKKKYGKAVMDVDKKKKEEK